MIELNCQTKFNIIHTACAFLIDKNADALSCIRFVDIVRLCLATGGAERFLCVASAAHFLFLRRKGK